MAILTHGSDLTLAPTLRPIARQFDGTVRTAIDRLADAGFRAVQLDGTLPGIRPRDLDQRGRRDLIGVLTRRGMTLAGIDLFLPRRHFLETENIDRAMAASVAAISLAADLGRVPVSISLPVKSLGDDARKAIVEAADGHGVRLAIHAEDAIDELAAWVDRLDLHALGIGIDPAAVLASGKVGDGAGNDPVKILHRLGRRVAVARLDDLAGADSDASDDEGICGAGYRCVLGEGDLDVLSYRIALDLAAGRTGPVVLDLRGLENPLAGALAAHKTWEGAAFRA